jgi:ATP-dependent DNA ligase
MSLRRTIEDLRPYPSLLLLGLPVATVEPLKLVAVASAGKGHWISGTVMIAACYAFSLLVVERLFAVVKPKLLTIPWFATVWEAFLSVRTRTWGIPRRLDWSSMLATLTDAPFDDPNWVFEDKYDGFRMVSEIDLPNRC